MFLAKTLIIAAVLTVVYSRTIQIMQLPYNYIEDNSNIINDDKEDVLYEKSFESVYPAYNFRPKREVQGEINTNSDGSVNLFAKMPLAGNENNWLSGTGSVTGVKSGSFDSVGAGLSLDNVNGHGLSLSGTHIPKFGNQLTAAARVNLLNTDNHDLNANLFTTRNLPNNPDISSFSTYGGGLDYMYKDKVGAHLGLSHAPTFHQTDLKAMGKLNLFKDRSSSLDFSAGATRSYSPFIPKSSWTPSIGMSYTKYF